MDTEERKHLCNLCFGDVCAEGDRRAVATRCHRKKTEFNACTPCLARISEAGCTEWH